MAKNPNQAGKGRRSRADLDVPYWTEGEGLAQVREWLREKHSDGEIAQLIGVDPSTVKVWKQKHPLFGTLFKIERKAAVPELLKHAYEHAMGYYRTNEVLDAQGNIREVKQWYPGNSNMQQFFLKNWANEAYRDKWEIDLGGKLPVVLTSDDQIPD